MTEELTHEQHKARAALMGREYDARNRTYCKWASTAVGRIAGDADALCCNTLEPLTMQQQLDRWRNRRKGINRDGERSNSPYD